MSFGIWPSSLWDVNGLISSAYRGELWQEYGLAPAKVTCGLPSQGSAAELGGPATWLAFEFCMEDRQLLDAHDHLYSALLGH